MTLTAYLAKAAALGFSAAALPGPFQVYLISQALRFGWRRASLAALAPLVSDGPIVVVVLLLLARLPAWMLSALQVAGGFFIAYLARNALRAARRSGAGSTPESRGGGALTLAQAATVNLLSPVVYVFWATVSGPLFALGWRQSPALGLSFVGVFYATMIGVSEVLVVAFAALRGASPIVTRAVMFLAAGLMAALAIVQVIQGLDGLGVWR